ncbi:winged helix-turn-helix domain-containing protein [Pseudomonas sp. Hp2]|uniref:winged helix-turn-helix domain-containing protein n=1 Tax=Pseudomonas sp. Hp2 TaxID=701189 RepID=UPI00112C0AA9|nr:winged helix-turn-helix domain-containing protein [Pseudomonas sp. Hp2]
MNSAPHESTSPSRLRIGDCVVHLASREVHSPAARRAARLTPKALAVLQVLAGHAGQVVSREQLLAEVWPDTLPTNDVVTQAVTQLRKALVQGEGREGGIETIAKTGYRLLGSVEWLDEPVAPASPASGPVPEASELQEEQAHAVPVANARPPISRRWLATAGLLLLAFAGGLSLSFWLRPEAEKSVAVSVPKPPYRLITSSGNFDITPTLSPDGSMVAYTSVVPEQPGTSILVKTTDNAPPRVLSRPPAQGSDNLPAWSPDGREIAFARHSADGQCRVMIASANSAADEREVTRCDGAEMLSFSWSPDGRALLFGSMPGGDAGHGIRRFDLASGRWTNLSYRAGPQDFDYAPRYSPNGKWIAFIRNPQMGDIWLMPADGGRPEPLTRDNAEFRGLTWLPDSSGLVFGRRIESQSRLYRIDLATRRVRDMGVDDAQAPVVSASKGKLAFVQRKPKFGIYRVERDGQGGYRREHLFASNGRDAQPMVAPNGRQIVFTSDRSGEFALWWADLAAPGSLRPVEGLVPETRQPPDWSPDSLSVLVVARDDEGRLALYEVMPALNRIARLTVPERQPLQAVYLSDPSKILVLGASEDGAATLSLYDRSSSPWKRVASLDDVSQVRVDRAGDRILFTRFSSEGLWAADAALDPASVSRVDADGPSRWRYRSWAVGAGGQIHYLSPAHACSTFESVLGDGQAPSGGCLDASSFSATNGFSIDAASSALYVSLASEEGSGIGFMDLPHERTGFVGSVPKLLNLFRK